MDLIKRRKNFGRWLRQCRKKSGVTQAELGKALGYDSSQLISNIERGVSLLPSKKLPEFARQLGCSLLELEVRYFQCSARNTSESRMPDLLLKYLPVIETLEYGTNSDEEFLKSVRQVKSAQINQIEESDFEEDENDIGPESENLGSAPVLTTNLSKTASV